MNDRPHDIARHAVERQFSIGGFVRLMRRWPLVFAVSFLVVFVAVVLFVGSGRPVFRSTATILLRGGSPAPGSFASLVEPRDSSTAAEMAILRSRAVAAAAVDELFPPMSEAADCLTLVEDARHEALHGLLGGGGGDGSLRADVDFTADDPPPPLRLEFVAEDRVKVGRAGSMGGWVQPQELAWKDGEPVRYRDVTLYLRPEGDVTGRAFTLCILPREDVVDHVSGVARISEIERHSGVLSVTVDDSHPERAADIANALAANYIALSSQRSREWASRTIDFIDEQLAQHTGELLEAERAVAQLMRDNPKALDLEGTAASLVQREADLDSSRVRVTVVEKAIEETLDLLVTGETDVLSYLNPDLLDPATRSLLMQINNLTTDAILLDRNDDSTARRLMMARVGDLEKWSEKVGLWIDALEDIVDAAGRGDHEALARIGNTRTIGLDTDPLTDTLLNELAKLRVERGRMVAGATAQHPRMVEIDASEADVQRRLVEHLQSRIGGLTQVRDAYDELLDSNRMNLGSYPLLERAKIGVATDRLRDLTEKHLRGRLDGLRGHLRTIEEEVATVRDQLATLPEEKRRLAGPTRRLESLKETVAFLMKSQQEAEISRTSVVGTAELVDPAVPAPTRTSPRLKVMLLLGLVIGLLAALGVAALLETYRGGVLDQAELQEATGLPVIGSIPTFSSGRAGRRRSFVPLRDDPNGAAAEAYRGVAAFLHGDDEQCRVVAVTSATEGEGKTVTNVDLALALARSGRRVLLIDGDLRCPSVHKVLKVHGDTGLADVLSGSAKWADCAWTFGVPGMWVLPAGKPIAAPADLLANGRLGKALQAMRADFDVIVIDLPPALVLNDLCFYARQLDMLLLLYRRNATPRRTIAAVASRLRELGVERVGAILNDAPPSGRQRRNPSAHARKYQNV